MRSLGLFFLLIGLAVLTGCASTPTVKDGYQYPRADEFGTVKMQAKPHFFPSYRLMKPRMISGMKRKITAAIKKRSAQ